ncbi:energy transducer TonB [Prosthecobacter sp.]|uniref:energy transducer TonB n=1 Tax=Prosthecobacter sp. TaxID=1965333 RepID=UPI00378531AD
MRSQPCFGAWLRFTFLAAGIATATAADKPTVYNAISGPVTEIDTLAEAVLKSAYTIVRLQDSPDYAPPKPTAGSLPHFARTPEGEYLGGYVLASYVVTAEGQAAAPAILKTDDERLNAAALKAIHEWRFQPASLKGQPVSSVSAQEFHFEATPKSFETQVLEPMGGKIAKPAGWFYEENHGGPKYEWTLTREDTDSGKKPYVTGVRIQLFTGIQEGTGKNARQFLQDFMDGKKKAEGVKVIKSCGAEDQGLFTRSCLEVEEGPFHVLYSLFWGSDGLDMAVVMVSGTRKELWEVYQPAFQKMRALELIDMKRFEK